MSVCLGFQCAAGVVLCADRQITDSFGMKYHRSKVWWSHNSATELMFIFAYAGEPNAAKVMFKKIRTGFVESFAKETGFHLSEKITGALERIYKDKSTKGLHTLIGVSIDKSKPALIRTEGSKVVEGSAAESIGVGDSSVLKYVTELLLKKQPTVEEASVLGAYVVSVASRYINGCSGGPDVATLYAGRARFQGPDVLNAYARYYSDYENRVTDLFGRVILKPLASQKSKSRP